MADVELECPDCAVKTVVSEYADTANLTCRGCGKALALIKPRSVSRFKLRANDAPPPDEQAAGPPAPAPAPVTAAAPLPEHTRPDDRRDSHYLKRDVRRVMRDRWLHRLSWLVFLALGALFYYLRFHGHVPGLTDEQFRLAGLVAVGVMYGLTIVLALHDNMFDGLLALVVPFYPFYYLFALSGAVFVRAFTGALLVAFGLDLLGLLQEWLTHLFDMVNLWIRSN